MKTVQKKHTSFLAILLFAIPFISYKKQNNQPNIIFFLVDDLGWTDVGCYGSQFYETPNIDALAVSGVRFTDAYAATPLLL